jgi:hypothetical protein
LGLGGVLALMAALSRDTPDLLLCVGGASLTYSLVYRNIPNDLATAQLVTVMQTSIVFYFILLNLMAGIWIYFVIESIDAAVGIYLIVQLIALQKLQRLPSREPRRRPN